MEGSVRGGIGNAGSSESRPPNPLAGANRQCFAGVNAGHTPISGTLVRHTSLKQISGIPIEPEVSGKKCEKEYIPIVRSGAYVDIGFRQNMEDTYVCCDNVTDEYCLKNTGDGPNAFYGVFFHSSISFYFFISLVVANAGDCRAVLSRRGKAIEMSSDHKPSCMGERKRIEATGGFVYDGYLNGQLNVARALGDWHMEGMKVADGLGPLSAEPEVRKMKLTEEDEFLIIGCDGIWDVFRSQNAVDFARRKLQEHNDPATCCKDLVDEALKRKSGDNLSVVVVCFNSIPPPALAAPKPRVQRSISAEGLKELQSFLNSLGN
ncbi:hypothetical protein KFK09_005279 [Dendrobium nobile]|uniref:protein-serine/threonine phosphatase n=1 Tax=Dendrobium nobile TaxID=94219 RepID=A0A8T3BV85_DENNO|nr:hypothetical protein KFK09_005279 [Dendrobium nobile]